MTREIRIAMASIGMVLFLTLAFGWNTRAGFIIELVCAGLLVLLTVACEEKSKQKRERWK